MPLTLRAPPPGKWPSGRRLQRGGGEGDDGGDGPSSGVLLDPEELVARRRGGEAEEALLAQPAGEPSPIPAAHGMT